MKYVALALFCVVAFPTCSFATVRITEIAWMGIAGSNGQYGEWIELYNDSTDAISVADWKLYSGGGSQLIFTLTKSIPAKSYFLIERTTASMPDPVPGVNDESGPFGGGGLSNSGEDLVLKDDTGQTVHSLSYGTGWPAGDAGTKDTMQWSGSVWVTAPATPKASYVGSGGGEVTPTSSGDTAQATRAPRAEPHIEFTVPSLVYNSIEYIFKAVPVMEYSTPWSGIFRWNMGDGTYIEQTHLESVSHTYKYPGTYTISFAYYRDLYEQDPVIFGTKTVIVQSPALTLVVVDGGKALEISNESSDLVDLSQWKLAGQSKEVVFPAMSIIAPRAHITILAQSVGLSFFAQKNIALISPQGDVMTKSRVLQSAFSQQIQGADLLAAASEASSNPQGTLVVTDPSVGDSKKRNRAKEFVFGAVALVVIGLSILLERAMAREE